MLYIHLYHLFNVLNVKTVVNMIILDLVIEVPSCQR